MRKLANPGFSPDVMEVLTAILAAVTEAQVMRKKGLLEVYEKFDGSFVTNADYYVQIEVSRHLVELERARTDILTRLALEEDMSERAPLLQPCCLVPAEFRTVLDYPVVWYGDAIDCTIFFLRGLPGWGSQWVRLRHGVFDASVFVAPDDLGGFVCVVEKGRGTWFLEGYLSKWQKAQTWKLMKNESPMVGYSKAISEQSWFRYFFSKLKTQSLPVQIVPAGLGLALAACGKLDLHILGPHYPWDWIPHLLPATEAGKAYRLYRVLDDLSDGVNWGRTEILNKPDLASLNPGAQHKVGVIIGAPKYVDMVVEAMCTEMKAFCTHVA